MVGHVHAALRQQVAVLRDGLLDQGILRQRIGGDDGEDGRNQSQKKDQNELGAQIQSEHVQLFHLLG
ncbi:hypothetical protein D3C86_2166460 [compost metagenome]